MIAIHRARLLKLAYLLETVPDERFGMENFCNRADHPQGTPSALKQCGTVACALGWSCALHPLLTKDIPDFIFVSSRLYGISSSSYDWEFLFSGNWRYIDDTAKGAAARIRYYVDGKADAVIEQMRWGELELEEGWESEWEEIVADYRAHSGMVDA